MTKDYKNTLNLPVTEFPMKASLAQREPEILKHWQSINIYQTLRREQQGKQRYVFNDGPPYANGNIHIGHALNKILKDIIVKSKNFSGFDAPFVPGWDCHGLPIELNVEKKLGKAGKDISAEAFRQACRAYANSQIAIQREEFKRLGIIGDWENPYLTMDFKYEANIIRALATIYANGFVTQGFKPVHWCIDCGSALAEAEVEYANKISPAIDVAFRVVDEGEFLRRIGLTGHAGEGAIIIPIWTTTPWTLPANEAVALYANEENDSAKYYELVQVINKEGEKIRLLVSAANTPDGKSLANEILQRYQMTLEKVIASQIAGKQLVGILLQHPFYEKRVSLVSGDHVTLDSGTGAVHIAPAHGQEDYTVGQKYHLPLVNPVGNNGCYLANTPLLAGEHIFKANALIIELLTANHNLLAIDKIEHSYPHCWRHKSPLVFLATPQWFVALHNSDDQHNAVFYHAIAATKKVHWLPQWGEENLGNMVGNRPDWCISRQRNWGTPIPIFVHKETRQPHPDTVKLMRKIAAIVEEKGLEAWFQSTPADWLADDADNYDKITDTLDVWFDSGVQHFCVLQQRSELNFPAEVVLEGSDQYRGWFQSLLLTSVAMHDDAAAPYKTVITHGFTVDEKGRKMSKSIGNVIAPEKVWNSLGADILRLWVASTDFTAEIAISDEILKRLSEAYRRIRNTARYFLSNLFDFDPAQHLVPAENMLSLDRWAIERAHLLQQQIVKAYDQFNFHEIYQLIHNFCIVDMGGFYLDVIKDRQYTTAKNSLARRSAQTAMFHLAHSMVRWLAPILSFTAEEIWQYLPGKKAPSVFLETWYQDLQITVKNDPLAQFERAPYWQLVMQIRDAVNKEIEKCRNEGEVGSSLEAEVQLHCKPHSKLFATLQALGDELRFVLITSLANVAAAQDQPANAMIVIINNEELWLKVAASTYQKCVRCWHRRADVGSDPENPGICSRCVENVIGEGEVRKFA